MLLAGDIGGTKTVLALYEPAAGSPRELFSAVFASREHASLAAILARFRDEHPEARVAAACFGVAGAVVGGRVSTTNLPWPTLDEAELSAALAGAPVKLLNDLEAAAIGMLELPASELVALNPEAGEGRTGNVAVIAAGTGLGEGFLVWDGERHHAVACEGGHTGFAPRNEEEIGLLRFLQAEYGRVSWERLLSGPGIHDLYRFLRSVSDEAEPAWLTERLAADDPGRVIGEAAMAKEDAVCERTIVLFCSLYGAEAGDLALKTLAVGGVYVGGGIAPRLLATLRSGGFMASFTDKGRFRELMRTIPVRVATNPRAPLLGAARRAQQLIS